MRWDQLVILLSCLGGSCVACTSAQLPTAGMSPEELARAQRFNCIEYSDNDGDCNKRGSRGRSRESLAAIAVFPKLNISTICEAAKRSTLISAEVSEKNCMDSENVARNALAKDWPKYAATDKARCVEMVHEGGTPSYVEVISCLEAMGGAKTLSDSGDNGIAVLPTPERPLQIIGREPLE